MQPFSALFNPFFTLFHTCLHANDCSCLLRCLSVSGLVVCVVCDCRFSFGKSVPSGIPGVGNLPWPRICSDHVSVSKTPIWRKGIGRERSTRGAAGSQELAPLNRAQAPQLPKHSADNEVWCIGIVIPPQNGWPWVAYKRFVRYHFLRLKWCWTEHFVENRHFVENICLSLSWFCKTKDSFCRQATCQMVEPHFFVEAKHRWKNTEKYACCKPVPD